MAQRMVWNVEPRDGRWAVKREHTARADTVFDHQEDAVARGVELASKNRGQLRIHGRDGQIRDERTYGDDPYPPKG